MKKGKSILEKIESKGINKSWLARKIGIKQSTLSNYLHEIRQMPEGVKKQINEIIG
jgi:ribosome-binding protein aMBF1 (putative translation factor)